jgi:hypothetical protein
MTERYYQKIANSVARKNGYGTATTILFGNINAPFILERTPSGYRKYTTGEYVSSAYRANFGWKNTYYQHAKTTVVLPFSLVNWN